jgi:hypothetical protein
VSERFRSTGFLLEGEMGPIKPIDYFELANGSTISVAREPEKPLRGSVVISLVGSNDSLFEKLRELQFRTYRGWAILRPLEWARRRCDD